MALHHGRPAARQRKSISGALRLHEAANRAGKSAAHACFSVNVSLEVKLCRLRSSMNGCAGRSPAAGA